MTGSSARQGGEREEAVIARRLQALFDEIQPKGRPYRQSEVVDGINAAAGERLISRQYLSELLHGDKDRPSAEIRDAIARFFGVSPAYFSGDAISIREELAVARAMQRAGIRALALRANDLSDANLAALGGIVDQILRMEGFGKDADDSADPQQG